MILATVNAETGEFDYLLAAATCDYRKAHIHTPLTYICQRRTFARRLQDQ